ncbi:putative COMM domain-containing protein [Naja naja]|nr:putative COMM domain-containing protein [Naja naja]
MHTTGVRATPKKSKRGGDAAGTFASPQDKMKLLEKLPAAETAKAVPRHRDYDTIWNLTEWMEVLEETASYFRKTIGKDLSEEELLNFDWQLKLALSSDKLSMLQMPLLNLDLDLSKDGDLKFTSVEMNKEELQALINALEAANKVVLQLK